MYLESRVISAIKRGENAKTGAKQLIYDIL